MTNSREVLDFWFGDAPLKPNGKLWFTGGKAADQEIKQHFGAAVQAALDGELSDWQQQPRSALALIVLLDQFTRNLFRGSARAFEGDPAALELCLAGIESGFPDHLHVLEAAFFFMPLEHSESMAMQDLCVQKFEELLQRSESESRDYIGSNLDYALSHRQIIQQFGRYPHRNETLGRSSTAAESSYLHGGGATFGQ
jgi:uncharacterized protein (DUF924 family)